MDGSKAYVARLYDIGSSTAVMIEGFALRTTDNASLEQTDGKIISGEIRIHIRSEFVGRNMKNPVVKYPML
jgi:hypothetical protein